MSAQTSYSINMAGAVAGLMVDPQNADTVSRAVEGVAGIGFGVAVSRGTDADKQVKAGGAAAFFGITSRDLNREGDGAAGDIKYNEFEAANLVRRGYVWVVVPSGCVPGDVANYVDATGVIDSGVPIAGETAIPNGEFQTTTTAGGLGLLRVDVK